MIFRLKSNDYRETTSLPPSMQVQGLECSRRLWLLFHHYRINEELRSSEKTWALKNHLDDIWKHDWRFEIRLPSGSRIDAWIPGEQVLIEFKTEQPHAKHLYQVWMMQEELQELAVAGMEFQLWYPMEWKEQALNLAQQLQLHAAENPAGLMAIAAEAPDRDFFLRRERDTAIMLADLEKEKPPPPKEIDSSPCRNCLYLEFCHS
ncbi:MAG: hypothetical protein JJU13_01345 [Balneolaceae bacterium]|nr:hypothetical protein [Balneolaceae bacterium]